MSTRDEHEGRGREGAVAGEGATLRHAQQRTSLLAHRHGDAWEQRRSAWRPAPLQERRRPGLGARAFAFCAKSCVMVVLAWALCFNFSEVRGGSMLPGIQDRDRILVDHVSYLFTRPARGDIAVLRYPMDPSLDYVKRVIGLPGDHVQICEGYVWVNGQLVEEPYVEPDSNDPYALVDTIVQEDSYFVLGDNRIRSSDSREFGQVPHEYLRGKVRARLWPIERASVFR